LTYGESVPAMDGKFRYFRDLREKIFATMREILKAHQWEDKMYLCMENKSVWEKSLGRTPDSNHELFGHTHSSRPETVTQASFFEKF